MAGKPPLRPPNQVATPDPCPVTVVEMLGGYYWYARSDRIWSKVMGTYHLVTEEELWLLLLEAAKRD